MRTVEIRHFHVCCGLGGGARGFNRGQARVGNFQAKFRCIGGVDSDPAGIADFTRRAGIKGTLLDLFSREQFIAFHGKEPPAGWREATAADIQRAAHGERPHIAFMSMPCKGFSGLLSETRSLSPKYQALNALALRGLWLTLEAWSDDPPEFILFENVPRIQTRGRELLTRIIGLLESYGYAARETTHDCGELGGLAQSRKRFLLVARHKEKVPPSLYQPTKRRLHAVGDVLGRLPMPGAEIAGAMHRLPALHWKTWVRLAFVEAGSDWRSLERLNVKDGVLSDYLIVPEMHGDVMGVTDWNEHSNTITGNARPGTGKFAVADPRINQSADYAQLGVRRWEEPTGTVSGQSTVGGGTHAVSDPRIKGVLFNHAYRIIRWDQSSPAVAGPGGAGGPAVADPRCTWSKDAHRNKRRVGEWDKPASTVTGSTRPGSGAACVADPRPPKRENYVAHKYRVTGFNESSGAVIGASGTGNGAFAVADPRPACIKRDGDNYLTGGHYGVVPWDRPANVVNGTANYDNGFHSVADPRLPEASERLVCVIRALDDTWHRPFTTLELAALQDLIDPEEFIVLHGGSDSAWRERIGNAVPSAAAEAIASVMGRALLMAWSGETFSLETEPVWVQPVAIALTV